MRVLLVNPPSENMITTNIPSVVDEERGFNPPLGLLYVAGYAKAHSSHEIRVLDCQVEEVSQEEVEQRIREIQPDVVGIQTLTFTVIDARMVAQAAKRAVPSCKVVMGGPHVHIYARETLDMKEVDFAIKGEGELAFTQLLGALEGLMPLSQVYGLAYRDPLTDQIKDNPPAPRWRTWTTCPIRPGSSRPSTSIIPSWPSATPSPPCLPAGVVPTGASFATGPPWAGGSAAIPPFAWWMRWKPA